MDDKNTNVYKIKKLRMPVSIFRINEKNEKNNQKINSDSLFAVTVQQGIKIKNEIGENLKKYNIFDFSSLHKEPDKSSFGQMFSFSLLYKSELGDPEEIAADNATASFVCGKKSEEFLKNIKDSGNSIVKCSSGIYRVNGFMLIDMYILVMSELEKLEFEWMQTLIRQAGAKCPEKRIDGLGCTFRTAEL